MTIQNNKLIKKTLTANPHYVHWLADVHLDGLLPYSLCRSKTVKAPANFQMPTSKDVSGNV